MAAEHLSEEALQARVAALRKLSKADVVPAVQEIVQAACLGEPFTIFRTVAGAGRAIGYKKAVTLQMAPTGEGAPTIVSEAAVVFGATACDLPAATWRGTRVLEMGCGSGYAGVLLAALGAKVTMTDLQHAAELALAAVALNSTVIKVPASAVFGVWDWSMPGKENSGAAAVGESLLADIASADFIVAADPVVDRASQEAFLVATKALLGLSGGPPLARNLKEFVVAHKHQQSYCISGYAAPTTGARPTITQADECQRCLFRRVLEDEGIKVTPWHRTPSEFQHPFVECWSLSPGERR